MTRPTLRRTLLVLGIVACFLALWAFWWEPARLTSETYSLDIPNWPQECADLRIATAGDLHVGSPYYGIEKLREVVREIDAAEPDLVLLPGDFVIQGVTGGTFVAPEVIARELGRLTDKYPVYAVLGNHDWWLDGSRVKAAFEGSGIPVLENQARQIQIGRCSFWLAGIGDYWEGKPDPAKALREVPPGAPVLGFTHNPDLFPDLPDRFSLMIAAHTHGGQVYFPVVGRLIVPSKFGERYAIGHVVEDGRHLFVNPGLGTSIIPVRFLVPPEVSVLSLR